MHELTQYVLHCLSEWKFTVSCERIGKWPETLYAMSIEQFNHWEQTLEYAHSRANHHGFECKLCKKFLHEGCKEASITSGIHTIKIVYNTGIDLPKS